MRYALAALLVGCGFSARLGTDAERDAAPGGPDAAPVDAALPACPAAPTGCTAFDCAASPGSCYYYCPAEVSSGGANDACGEIVAGSCLATLNDAPETTCIVAAAGAGELVYVGLRQTSGPEPADGWSWYCGSSTFGPNWNTGEPTDSFPGEDCAAINDAGKWVDVSCGERFRYVCEAPRPAM